MKKLLAFLVVLVLLLPVCALAASPVTITSTTDNGDCTVTMKFNNPNGSKTTVGAMLVGNEDAVNKLIVDETTGSSYTFTWLAPGESYMVVAMNGFDTDTLTYDVVSVSEPPQFDDYYFSVSDANLTYFVPKGSSYSYNYAKNLSPNEIKNLMDEKQFWVKIDFDHTTNTADRYASVLTVVKSPTGYIQTDADNLEIKANTTGFWRTMVYMNDAFDNMIEAHGSIPTGKYEVTVYLDGKLAGTSSFKIN